MTRDEIIAKLRASAEAIKAEGVTRLAIFGSRARGDERPDSDLNVLIDVEPEASFSLLNLVGLEHPVRDAAGLVTQATMRRSLDPEMSRRIADDIVDVF